MCVSVYIILYLPYTLYCCRELFAKQAAKKHIAFSLIMGGIGLISIYFIQNHYLLLLSMVGIGLAWGSILAMPYAILSSSIPVKKIGVYMGIFNFFITFPQIVNGVIGGPIVKYFYHNHAIYALIMAGVFMFFGAISVLYVQDGKRIPDY